MIISIQQLSAQDIATHMSQLANLLVDVVTHGASVNFVMPFTVDDAKQFWRKVAGDVATKDTILLVALADNVIVGSVMLALAWQPNAPHRAEVQKMLVRSNHRRRGIASQLLNAAEEKAHSAGRWLLFLDTEFDSGARFFYEQAGYQRVGIIPKHALNAAGKYADTILYYKLLRE